MEVPTTLRASSLNPDHVTGRVSLAGSRHLPVYFLGQQDEVQSQHFDCCAVDFEQNKEEKVLLVRPWHPYQHSLLGWRQSFACHQAGEDIEMISCCSGSW